MPAPCQIARKEIDSPKIGHMGYQGFLKGKTKIHLKGSAPFKQRVLPCDILVENDVPLKLRDGVVIYADIYRPPDGGEKVPAIFSWSPFGKKLNGLMWLQKMTPYNIGVSSTTISGLEKFEGPDPATFVDRGYAVVNTDTRGVGDSEGMCVIMGTQEGEDGHDAVEAVAAMPWCSGSVGMAGNSHLAIAQWFIAQQRPPSLKAIAPWEGCGDLFREQFVRGGIWSGDFFDHISKVLIHGYHGMEDFKEMYRRSGGVGNDYWYDKRPDMTKINIPAYITSSFSSALHPMGSIRGYMHVDNPNKWLRFSPYQEWYDIWAVPKYTEELLAFFDRYLKGIENSWEATPHVRMCTILFGEKDAVSDEPVESFPPPQTIDRDLYFGQDGTLGFEKPAAAPFSTQYHSEDAKSSVKWAYTFDKPSRLCGIPKAVLYMSCDDHDDMDVYVMVRKLDKSGNPMMAINCPWSAIPPNTIEEIPEDKTSDILLYTGPLGVLRASHREFDLSKSMHPNYPFHPHARTAKVPKGEVVKLEIGIFAMSVGYEAGESVQVEVVGQSPQIQSFGPLKGKKSSEENRGVHKVHCSSEYPSHILLPFFET
ncbi:CocE/NonD hydrolase [Pleurostoma richardsiae]|uniref:CocE/NonD hydrolase n=1 Tax=Pleurostoma richardsiae TaxID=41990 RepID=A0AA38R997_9PEZI|nr:CocE/NonD hydrolase [Pleurostoma richardsiae]